ncbi:MAG: DUF4185 domain-containing protein [Rikenellaceae bacterium]|nr:DUF4185 domain-containing protein [Rikenellaceae bacterium]
MKMLKLLCVVFLLAACGKSESSGGDGSDGNYAKDIVVTLTPSSVAVKGAGANVSTSVGVNDATHLKWVTVAKYRGTELAATLDNLAAESFVAGKRAFSYVLTEEDARLGVSFRFAPVDENGNTGDEATLTVAVAGPSVYPTGAAIVSRMTGATPAGESYPNPNQTHTRYNIGGSDLGIYWRMGGNKVGILFGDTYGRDWRPGYTPDWRSNVLAFSTDTDMSNGLSFDDMVCDTPGNAKEIIYSAHDVSGNGDWSSIPTAAIRIGGTDYVHYMNVKAWNPRWLTNYSGYATSTDGGQTWTLHKNVFSASSRFAQVALWEEGEWIYAMGSIIGRRGLPYLARFKGADILRPDRYQYWNATRGWLVGDELLASPLFGNYTDEMYAEPTLVYHRYFGRWITVYYNEIKQRMVMRDAPEPTGPWSEERMIVDEADYPKLYGGFIHPLQLDGPAMYLSFSQWDPLYNVFLMKVDLAQEE